MTVRRSRAAYCIPTDILVGGIGCRYEKKEGECVNVYWARTCARGFHVA